MSTCCMKPRRISSTDDGWSNACQGRNVLDTPGIFAGWFNGGGRGFILS